jgi:hypothetical protein
MSLRLSNESLSISTSLHASLSVSTNLYHSHSIIGGPAAEVQSQLYVALDQGYINQQKFAELYAKSDEVARLISGFIKYLLSKPKNSMNSTNSINSTNSNDSTNPINSTNC